MATHCREAGVLEFSLERGKEGVVSLTTGGLAVTLLLLPQTSSIALLQISLRPSLAKNQEIWIALYFGGCLLVCFIDRSAEFLSTSVYSNIFLLMLA